MALLRLASLSLSFVCFLFLGAGVVDGANEHSDSAALPLASCRLSCSDGVGVEARGAVLLRLRLARPLVDGDDCCNTCQPSLHQTL
jgi:hypothetical protein